MKLYIKNMVTHRCILVVRDALEKLGIRYSEVNLGEVSLKENISDTQLNQIKSSLLSLDLELLEDKKTILVQQIKTLIIDLIYHSDEPLVKNLSVYLSLQLQYDYTYMSNLFSNQQGITIEKYYICHKIERVKELLLYNELSLTDIAFNLHYSSVAHLSAQFKKVTGVTPTQFKQTSGNKRDLIENVCGDPK
ncbi:AraC family transcriptional regulator [Niastella koreensis]|uniref:Transcriptional regulator, AraC family n=2 Tax=Niastella koreensis TaxID=354356 RepID=G8TIT8_NIAKG|nr:AraC family transcriptional regulator [Niastella koreensis]AEV96432.1 transcriptional regulator, AraC family [Niastella koreensis GR20-10]OQP53963.1 AraC family transcriptional regulator [Niastella koreensis]